MTKRKLIYALTTVLLLTLLAGCATKTATTPTKLPTGAVDQTDATVYRVLLDAQAFLSDIRTSVAAGKLTLTPAQKTAFNNVATSYNAVEAAWQQYHAGQSKDGAGLSTQASALSTQLSTAQNAMLVSQ